ncbi:unnamed protein product [Agarophyton chilense]
MSRRVRTDILARVFRENVFPPAVLHRLRQLQHELANAARTPLTFVQHDGGPDVDVWNCLILKPVVDTRLTWLSAPWAVAEFYLYRRLMTAIDYFRTPTDPFQLQKDLGLSSAVDSISMLAERVNNVLSVPPLHLADPVHLSHFQSFVLTSLWGNRIDLSLWPVGGADQHTVNATGGNTHTAQSFSSVLQAGQKMILSNHMPHLVNYVSTLAPARFDIIVDNAAFELFCDLCLADFLVHTKMATVVHIQLKAHPTFVSDAMAKDVHATISFLQAMRAQHDAPTPTSVLGDRWAAHISSGRWILNQHFFWVQPQPMWEMPSHLCDHLSRSALTFVKGDANYRRLLGDRDWPLDTPFDDVLCYFPSPVCALRTLKAELGCGMKKENTDRAASEDEKWLVAGKYGVVQFCDTRNG